MPRKCQERCHLGLQTDFVKGNNISQYFFVTSFGLFVLIADPKVVVVTETINSKNKIKLKWSMVNLKRQCLKETDDCLRDSLKIENTKQLTYCFLRCTRIYFCIT